MSSNRLPARMEPARTGSSTSVSTPRASFQNDLDFPTAQRTEGSFCQLRDQLAFKGVTLIRSDRTDGPVSYWIEFCGVTHRYETLDELRDFLDKTEGHHGN